MPRKRRVRLKCPTCQQPVKGGSPDFPFCSERCRLVDLGKWASGAYVVSSPVTDISEAMEQNPPTKEDED